MKMVINKTRSFLGKGVKALLKHTHAHKPAIHPLHKVYHKARFGLDFSPDLARLPKELALDEKGALVEIERYVEKILHSLGPKEREAVYEEFHRLTPEPKGDDSQWDTELMIMALNNRCHLPGHGECAMGLGKSFRRQPSRYAIGEGEGSSRFGYINGIARSFAQARGDALRFSAIIGQRVHGIHNATNGGVIDLGQAFLHQTGRPTKVSALLQQEWREYLATHSGNYIQLCHSDGASCVYHALQGMSEEERSRIVVIAIAPATFIPDAFCAAAYHIVNETDPVVMLSVLREKASHVRAFSRHTKGYVPHDPFDPQITAALCEILAHYNVHLLKSLSQ